MHTFEPGQKVTHVRLGECIFVEWDGCSIRCVSQGAWAVYHNVRPSELTPADPGPDWATLKVRELCAAEWEEVVSPITARRWREGIYDKEPPALAFAKYLRANPPQGLTAPTLEMVRAVLTAAGDAHHGLAFAKRLHATLTEQAK